MYFITYPITVITCIFYTFTIRSCCREQEETVDLVSYQTIEVPRSANYMLSDIFTTLMIVTKCDVQDKSKFCNRRHAMQLWHIFSFYTLQDLNCGLRNKHVDQA